jgi:UPF0716 protein FxsA
MARLVIGLIFIVVPVLELALLIQVGRTIGLWPTVGLVMVTAVTGAVILSQQGFATLRRTLEAASQGQPPVKPVLDGMFLLIAGALLLTPGLITDVAALLLLIPPVRHALATWIVRAIMKRAKSRVEIFRTSGPSASGPASARESQGHGPIIEGEFERLGENAAETRKGNGQAH